MTRILSIDASTDACSVALLNGDEITECFELAPREHARLLLPMVEKLLGNSGLKLSQLDAIACNVGPGAFTGIRIAVSVAQGLAYGASLPTISLSTLANLAASGFAKNGNKSWLCAIDARMQEIYFAAFIIGDGALPELIGREQVIAPNLLDLKMLEHSLSLEQAGLIGSGWEAYKEILLAKIPSSTGTNRQLFKQNSYPSAQYGLGQAKASFDQGLLLKPEALQPVYLRNNVAVKKSLKK